MEVRTGDAARATHQADDLALLDVITGLNPELGLVPESAVHTPAVVDDGGIASHGPEAGKNHPPGSRGGDGQACPAAEIQPGVEAIHA